MCGNIMVPGEGFEPPTFGLQNRCTTTVLTRRRRSFYHDAADGEAERAKARQRWDNRRLGASRDRRSDHPGPFRFVVFRRSGNRVNTSRCEEAYEELIVPPRDLSSEAE
jgi:hypothetical protein